MIHTVLILKKPSGLKVWSKTFSNSIAWDEYLTSGLISAIFSFSKELFGADVHDLELGPYKILFESGAEEFILVAVFDKFDSVINVREKLDRLNEELQIQFGDVLKRPYNKGGDFHGVDILCDVILKEKTFSTYSEGLKEYLIDLLDEFRSHAEILDCDLVSTAGVPLVHDRTKEFLDLCLRQIDAFWKSTTFMVDQITVSYRDRHVILFKVNEQLVLTSLVRRDTPMGLATLMAEEYAEKISKFCQEL
jgi:hypothetical protein